MKLPDILQDVEGLALYVKKITHKREKADTEEGDGLFSWTIDLTVDLTKAKLDDEPNYLAGAGAGIQRAVEGKGSGRWYYEPINESRSVVATIYDNDGEIVLNQVNAEIRIIEVRATEEDSRFRVRLLIPGLLSTSSAALLEVEHRAVSLNSSPVQVSLDLEAAA